LRVDAVGAAGGVIGAEGDGAGGPLTDDGALGSAEPASGHAVDATVDAGAVAVGAAGGVMGAGVVGAGVVGADVVGGGVMGAGVDVFAGAWRIAGAEGGSLAPVRALAGGALAGGVLAGGALAGGVLPDCGPGVPFDEGAGGSALAAAGAGVGGAGSALAAGGAAVGGTGDGVAGSGSSAASLASVSSRPPASGIATRKTASSGAPSVGPLSSPIVRFPPYTFGSTNGAPSGAEG
jgi:hypothetical protein